MAIYYVDGEFVPAEKAVIPVDDLAILRGLGVFDFLRTYGGKPYFLDEHISRLENSARKVNLDLPWSHEDMVDIVLDTLGRNHFKEANARIVITGGSSPDFMTPQGNPRLLVLVSPVPELPAEWYTEGVGIITEIIERDIPTAKSINYITASIALKKAKQQNAVEVLYVDRKDNVLECTTSNIFAFMGDDLITPGEGILSGITRKVVMDLAKDMFNLVVRDMSKKELLAADEVLITGTSKGVVPVVRVDRHTIGSGLPGPKTRQLMKTVLKHTRTHQKP